jgi:hypothetical protein
MNETEWLTSSDPDALFAFVSERVSERKLRLCACACCRLLPEFMEVPANRLNIEVTERDADEFTTENPFDGLEDPWDIRWYRRSGPNALGRVFTTFLDVKWEGEQLHELDEVGQTEGRQRHQRQLVELLHDHFGNPFQTPTFNAYWRTTDVLSLAQSIYQARAFERLPILADALMDAGCDANDILSHCRSNTFHARGCWVVDLILGKV